MRKSVAKRKSFTLVEVLISIGVVTVLSVVGVLILRPAELLKESRDSTRILNLKNLNLALSNFAAAKPNASLGAPSTTYVSLIDSTSTCANLGLPALPEGYSYHCATSSDSEKNINGTGWLPVDFTRTTVPTLDELPVDPVNSASGGLYYAYNSPGSAWQVQINTTLESTKYASRALDDGGVSDSFYEVGGNFNTPVVVVALNPVPTADSISPTGVGAGSPEFTLTVNGTNFIFSSVVNFEGAAKATTYVSSTQLTATIPAADIAIIWPYSVTVTNPSPGGGTSGSQTFTTTNSPVAPSNVAATGAILSSTRAQFTVTWTDNSSNETSQAIQWARNAAFTSGVGTGYVGANVTTYQTPTGGLALLRNVNYWFRVRSYNASGTSAYVVADPVPVIVP